MATKPKITTKVAELNYAAGVALTVQQTPENKRRVHYFEGAKAVAKAEEFADSQSVKLGPRVTVFTPIASFDPPTEPKATRVDLSALAAATEE